MSRLCASLFPLAIFVLLMQSATLAVPPVSTGPSFIAHDSRLAQGASPAKVEYAKDVAPLLMKHCVACHGPKQQESELRLDSVEAMLLGGKKGPAIVRGKGATSRLILALRGEGGLRLMPPDAPDLKPDEIKLLTRWIDQQTATPK